MIRTSTALVFLLAAWFCANRPQAVLCELFTWLQRSTEFSHQERLVTAMRETFEECARAADESDFADRFAAAEDTPENKRIPARPAGGALTKIELALPVAVEVLVPASERTGVEDSEWSLQAIAREVLLPPPRVATAV